MKRFGYSATSDLSSDSCSSHFTELRLGGIKIATSGIKIAMVITFVELFDRFRSL